MVPKCAAPQGSSWARPWNSAELARHAPPTVVRQPSRKSVAPPATSPSSASAAARATGAKGVAWPLMPMPNALYKQTRAFWTTSGGMFSVRGPTRNLARSAEKVVMTCVLFLLPCFALRACRAIGAAEHQPSSVAWLPQAAIGVPGRRDQPAAIDRHVRTRNGGRKRRSEKCHDLGDLRRLDQAAERRIAGKRRGVALALVDRRLQRGRSRIAGRNRVDPRLRRAPFGGEAFGGRDDGGLGRPVGMERHRAHAGDRSDVDDGAAAAREHVAAQGG